MVIGQSQCVCAARSICKQLQTGSWFYALPLLLMLLMGLCDARAAMREAAPLLQRGSDEH